MYVKASMEGRLTVFGDPYGYGAFSVLRFLSGESRLFVVLGPLELSLEFVAQRGIPATLTETDAVAVLLTA